MVERAFYRRTSASSTAQQLTPDNSLFRRTPTMPEAPATSGSDRNLSALAATQPSELGLCRGLV